MDSTILDKRPKFPSILTVYRPIADYWASIGPERDQGQDVERLLDPFDALLIHLVLDLTPGSPVLVDLAAGTTAGASSVIGLTHPQVRRVVAVTRPGSLVVDRAVSALRGFVRGRATGFAPLDVLPIAEMPAGLSDRARIVILADVRGGDVAELAASLRLWLDEMPDALVLLLGLGKVGECPGIEAMLELCPGDSGRRFRLFRELGEILAASHLGILVRDDHPHADEILLRLRLLYDGNFRFLDLLRSVNQAAMQDAQVDDEVLKTHPLSRPLRTEIETLRRATQEANEKAESASHALAAMSAQREELLGTIRELSAQTVAATPILGIVRRKLAIGIAGKLYRASKRSVRRRLSSIGSGR